jgi:Holliday junction resolvasome RuvABC DNA-binding subunit
MIGKLTGTLSLKNPPDVLVDCHGVSATRSGCP